MTRLIFALISSLALFLIISCVGGKSPEPPASTTQQENLSSQTPIPENNGISRDIPFQLTVNGLNPGPDNDFRVDEGSIVPIGYAGKAAENCEMKVSGPDGTVAMLGQWNSDFASFFYRFPYGENTLTVMHGDDAYEFLVISGVPTSSDQPPPCAAAMIDIRPDAEWVYNWTSETEAPATWTQHITDFVNSESGELTFTLIMEKTTGIEERVTHTTTLHLICSDNTIFVTGVEEVKDDVTWTTFYDPDSVYMPSNLAPGIIWERHGTIRTISTDIDNTSSITERQQCTGPETISVASGEFNAFRVEYSLEIKAEEDSYTVDGTAWYVPGLGRVLNIGNSEGTPKMELVSFKNVGPRD